MAIIDSVKTFIETCPLLARKRNSGVINVNYLGDSPVKYSIDVIPVDPIVRRYTDGGTQRQFLFSLASRETYSRETLENIDTARFYEEFSAWLEEQDRNGNYPDLGDGLKPTYIGTSSSGFLISADETSAQFQIQCKIVYIKDRA